MNSQKQAKFVSTFGGEHYLNEYEIITNDEFEDETDEIVDLTKNTDSRRAENLSYQFPRDEPFKLQLNLNTTQISLKSQSMKINKSIMPEKKMESPLKKYQMYQSNKMRPSTFNIEPLANENIHTMNCESNESNNLPEIILTSFEMRKDASKAVETLKKSATVSFQTKSSSTGTTQFGQSKSPTANNFKEKQSPRLFANIPILPPPTVKLQAKGNELQSSATSFKNSNSNSNATTTVAEIHGGLRRDSDDSSEFHSLYGGGGNSTSPESLIDLSAASSVSVCESSNIDVESPGKHAAEESDIRRRCQRVVHAAITTMSTPIATSTEVKKPGKKEIPVNGAFKKSNQISNALPTMMSTLPTPEPSPSPSPEIIPTALSKFTPTIFSESQSRLQPPECSEKAYSSPSRSPSPSPSVFILPDSALYPDELKCKICANLLNDPRTLNCLHSFCFQCLVNENFNHDKSIPFWSQPNETIAVTSIANENIESKSSVKSNCSYRSLSPDTTIRSHSETSSSPLRQRRSSFTFRRKKSQDRINPNKYKDGRLSSSPKDPDRKVEDDSEPRSFINCKTCQFRTELPVGGLRQLPQNFVLTRKIEEIKLKASDETISNVYCTLCFDATNATYHCISCTLNLCTLCKDAHERQRNTANHTIRNIMDLRRARRKQQSMLDDLKKFTLKCSMHPGFEIKSFCTVCLQIACNDCLVLFHKGHKHETISKAITNYSKVLNNYVEQTRPLYNISDHAIERLTEATKDINKKCDEVQDAIENFMQQYFEALAVHKKTLLQQVQRARESKIEILLEQQMDMEKRSSETQEAIRFCQDLREQASDVEILSFLNILFQRFEYCQQFKAPIDPKFSDSLHFLPHIVAPSTKEQNDITLYGIITMQIVEPTLCTLQVEGFSHLRIHKRVELTILTRDADGMLLCHGGMLKLIQANLKFKDNGGKDLPFELSDNRDGTYVVAFTPDSPGTLTLSINIDDKPIKGSPFKFLARSVRPHSGIYHCCSFCSSGKSKGNKSIKCSCDGRMPGYNGCGHGHAGHPGRRHWSCCGSILENSECIVANKLLS